jgi:hypothetical protein
MNLRFAGMITGCMLVGASAAAYHRADSRPTPSGATLAAATPDLPTPLFPQAATGAPTSAAWTPGTSVAFYGEMFEQLPAATAPAAPAQAATAPAAAAAETETPPAAAPRVRVIPLPRAPQTLPAPNATVGAGIPQTPRARGANAGNGQQTLPPVRDSQAPPVRTANITTGGAQTPPPGNSNVGAGGTQTPAVDHNAGNGGQPTPRRAGVTPPRGSADMVEIVIRDRFGRPIRVERVDRRRLSAVRAHQPPRPHRVFHSYPQGPHGGYR